MNENTRASFRLTAVTRLVVFALTSCMACQEPVFTSPVAGRGD
jgi:hypothetical protein